MLKPEERQTTDYEWVVEQIAEGDSGDIVDCHYWSENQLDEALRCFAQTPNPDFGLCRRQGTECDGESDRQYAYAEVAKTGRWIWPLKFDAGAAIPVRLLKRLPKGPIQ